VDGVSTRSADDLHIRGGRLWCRAMACSGVTSSQVPRLCADTDERVQAFLHRRIEGNWPYVRLDATDVTGTRPPAVSCWWGHYRGGREQ
jgi:putative transposase